MGVVTIAVIEGHYDKIALRNRARLRNGVARGVLAGLNSGDTSSRARRSSGGFCCSPILPGVEVAFHPQSRAVPAGTFGI